MESNDKALITDLEAWGAEPDQVLEETFMGDIPFYKECLLKFSQEEHLKTVKESLVPEKMKIAIRAVHTMKGNSDYLGLFPVTDAAVSVLTDLRKEQLDLAIDDLSELENAFAKFLEIMKKHLS